MFIYIYIFPPPSRSIQIIMLNVKNNSAEFIGAHEAIVLALSISSDGKYLLSGSKDGVFKIWNVEKGFE